MKTWWLSWSRCRSYEGIEVANFEDDIPNGALVWHQDGGNMTLNWLRTSRSKEVNISRWVEG